MMSYLTSLPEQHGVPRSLLRALLLMAKTHTQVASAKQLSPSTWLTHQKLSSLVEIKLQLSYAQLLRTLKTQKILPRIQSIALVLSDVKPAHGHGSIRKVDWEQKQTQTVNRKKYKRIHKSNSKLVASDFSSASFHWLFVISALYHCKQEPYVIIDTKGRCSVLVPHVVFHYCVICQALGFSCWCSHWSYAEVIALHKKENLFHEIFLLCIWRLNDKLFL